MNNRYVEKFKYKSKYELLEILEKKEKYTKTAVLAAELLLKQNGSENECDIVIEEQKSNKDDFGFQSIIKKTFNPSLYLHSFNIDLILTNLCLPLVVIVVFKISQMYHDEFVVFRFLNDYKGIIFLLMLIVNNVIFKIETGRSNNFVGRCINDLLFLVIFILLIYGYNFAKDSSFSSPILDSYSFIVIFLFLIFSAMVFELLIGLLKRFLVKLRIDLI